MSVFIFTGPTLSAADAGAELDAVYLPPAGEGDLYRAALRRPQAIGLIDGLFQSVPAVRHKEILWAMSQGIHVFGSASMGALRAAELWPFGMEGVGVIFESYRDGRLEDDDEVAIAHGPSEVGFVAASEAMVDIRPTLRRAEQDGIIPPEVGTALERIAKQLFYPTRSYPQLLNCALESGLPAAVLARLELWLPGRKVRQKREDALTMLRTIRARLDEGLKPKKVAYFFEHTSMWECARYETRRPRFSGAADEDAESVLRELRLQGATNYRHHRFLAAARELALLEANRLDIQSAPVAATRAEEPFGERPGLNIYTRSKNCLTDSEVSEDERARLMTEEARIEWVHARSGIGRKENLIDELRLCGEYTRLRVRAEDKKRVLDISGSKNSSLADVGMTEETLLRWYFVDVLGESVPNDLAAYLTELGYETADALFRTLLDEYVFRHNDAAGGVVSSREAEPRSANSF